MRYLTIFCLVLLLPTGAGAQQVTCMTYNIRYDNPADGEDAWPVRRDFLAGQLHLHAPDVFGVQEALKPQLDYLLAQLPNYASVGVARDDGREKGEYSALLYRTDRYVAEASGTFWLSVTPDTVSTGWDAAMPRICTWADLRDTATGARFRVLNTHFDHIGEKARARSAVLLLDFLANLKADRLPVVVMGDLNCEPGAEPITILSEQLQDTHAYSQVPPFGPEGTFNGFNFHDPVTRRIDYIFVSGDWIVEQYAVLSDSRNCHYPSDHLPVLARLRLR
ncbi:MAG: endonuclease/exonuclease/phosphatase family protein [Bacteroidetes bacterium]|nr:MAG: endonuclease/exonuclease/phosphatase family protein [Bacteroidota bacterium]